MIWNSDDLDIRANIVWRGCSFAVIINDREQEGVEIVIVSGIFRTSASERNFYGGAFEIHDNDG